MFIELVDALRCLAPHEDTWLVAAVARMEGRHIVDGMLGCPICHREYPIRHGVGWFGAGAPRPVPTALDPAQDETAARALRVAALLGIVDPGGIVVLGTDWADCADAVSGLGVAHAVILAAADTALHAENVSALVVDDRLPFAAGTLRGIAVGSGDAVELAPAAELLRGRGRMVAPVTRPVPATLGELARDDHDWVAERGPVASTPVTLRSARR